MGSYNYTAKRCCKKPSQPITASYQVVVNEGVDTSHALQQGDKLQILLSPLSLAKEGMNGCQLQQADKCNVAQR